MTTVYLAAGTEIVLSFLKQCICLYNYVVYLKSIVSVIHGMFDHEVLECGDSQLSDLGAALESFSNLSQKQTHQEMVFAVILSQAVLQTLI